MKDMPAPDSYKAMCRQCGAIVAHRLDQSTGSDLRKWFRAKNWHAIAAAFDKHDPKLSAVIRAQF
jgi:hypothetical protein